MRLEQLSPLEHRPNFSTWPPHEHRSHQTRTRHESPGPIVAVASLDKKGRVDSSPPAPGIRLCLSNPRPRLRPQRTRHRAKEKGKRGKRVASPCRPNTYLGQDFWSPSLPTAATAYHLYFGGLIHHQSHSAPSSQTIRQFGSRLCSSYSSSPRLSQLGPRVTIPPELEFCLCSIPEPLSLPSYQPPLTPFSTHRKQTQFAAPSRRSFKPGGRHCRQSLFFKSTNTCASKIRRILILSSTPDLRTSLSQGRTIGPPQSTPLKQNITSHVHGVGCNGITCSSIKNQHGSRLSTLD